MMNVSTQQEGIWMLNVNSRLITGLIKENLTVLKV